MQTYRLEVQGDAGNWYPISSLKMPLSGIRTYAKAAKSTQ